MSDSRSALIKYFDPNALARITAVGYKPFSLVEGNLVGNHRSPFHGFAIEFAGLRQYVPGDEVKHLDWKAYFKTGKFLVKQYDQETNLIGHILVDVSETMKFEYSGRRKIDYTAFIATAVAGAIVMLISDTIAQLPNSEYSLPINAVTSLFGAPIVIWLLVRKRKISY
jgi:hypothetical protein